MEFDRANSQTRSLLIKCVPIVVAAIVEDYLIPVRGGDQDADSWMVSGILSGHMEYKKFQFAKFESGDLERWFLNLCFSEHDLEFVYAFVVAGINNLTTGRVEALTHNNLPTGQFLMMVTLPMTLGNDVYSETFDAFDTWCRRHGIIHHTPDRRISRWP